MDDLNQNNQQPVNGTSTPVELRHAVGPLIGAGIVIILIILGGLYFWGAKLNDAQRDLSNPAYILGDDQDELDAQLQQEDALGDAAVEVDSALPTQSTSDDTSAIDADLKAMDINGLTSQTTGDVGAFGSQTQ